MSLKFDNVSVTCVKTESPNDKNTDIKHIDNNRRKHTSIIL